MLEADDENVTMHVGQALTSYCFGSLPDDERTSVEEHLLACDTCWNEFKRLDAAVSTLRFDPAVKPTLHISEVVSLFGLSSRLTRPFGGHAVFVVTIAQLYGLEWMVGLWSELGYSYDRFGTLAWALSVPVAAWVIASMLAAAWFDTKATRAGHVHSLRGTFAIVLCALGAMTACLVIALPKEPTILASFQTRTSSSGYFKDATFIFLPLLAFIVPPFHTVLRLQHELRAGRYREVLSFLGRDHDGLTPRGLWYLSPTVLTALLLVLGVLKLAGTNRMLDALTPGPYANLFTLAAYVSTGLWCVIPLVCLVWYSSSLNELKRECVALKQLAPGQE